MLLCTYTTGIIQTLQAFIMYTNTDYNIHGPIPLLFPFCSPFESPLLTWTPPRCNRIRPPRSQVAGKLIFPFPSPCSYTNPSQNPYPPEFPRSKYTFIRTTSRIWLTRSRTVTPRQAIFCILLVFNLALPKLSSRLHTLRVSSVLY